jgi:hypothetical protein
VRLLRASRNNLHRGFMDDRLASNVGYDLNIRRAGLETGNENSQRREWKRASFAARQ